MPKTMIVPLDGSEFAERAVVPALTLTRQSGAALVLVIEQVRIVVFDDRPLARSPARCCMATLREGCSAVWPKM